MTGVQTCALPISTRKLGYTHANLNRTPPSPAVVVAMAPFVLVLAAAGFVIHYRKTPKRMGSAAEVIGLGSNPFLDCGHPGLIFSGRGLAVTSSSTSYTLRWGYGSWRCLGLGGMVRHPPARAIRCSSRADFKRTFWNVGYIPEE